MRFSNELAMRRRGFTLVEVLVVIAIIAILVALAGAAYTRLAGSQMQKRTENTVGTLQAGLIKQRQAALDDIRDEILGGGGTAGIYQSVVINLANGDQDLAAAIWTKMRLTQEFPTTFAESNSPVQGYLGSKSAYQSLWNLNAASYPGFPLESAICLYMTLSQNRRGVIFNPADLGGNATSSITLTDKNNNPVTLNYFIDGWGKPITYERWTTDPTIFAELASPPYSVSGADPEDPFNKISSWSGASSAPGYLYTSPLGAASFTGSGGTNTLVPSPYGLSGANRGPVVRSAGLDGVGFTSDDILGYRLMSAGQRGN